ncbi:MAG TPA: oligosaccharide flippase family protein [Roseiflexaceae bacterium]|nr:oligosaccharide flippase family protein [Roseiflexaceae bacterium]HMP39055.1 oligosaccharide flippase family protein [Roseiflexaceae bacterium]
MSSTRTLLRRWLASHRGSVRDRGIKLQSAMTLLFSGMAASLVGSLAASALGALVQILVVRQLGTLLYGEYATLTATLAIIASLLGIGLDTWTLHDGSRDPQHLIRNVWHVLLLKAIGAAILLVLLTVAWSAHIVQTPVFVVGIIGIICDSFTMTGYSALRALKRYNHVAVVQVISPILLLAALWGLQYAPANVLLIFIAQAISSLIIAAILISHVFRLCGSPAGLRIDLRYAVGGAWLFVASDLFSSIYTQSSVSILGNTVGADAVGIFRPALNVLIFLFLPLSLIFLVGLPLLNDPSLTRSRIRALVAAMAGMAGVYGVAAGIGLIFFADLLIRLLYGDVFAAAADLLQQMWFIPLLKGASLVSAAVMLAHGGLRIRTTLQLLIAIGSLIGGWLLIPTGGVGGALSVYTGVEICVCISYVITALFLLQRAPR